VSDDDAVAYGRAALFYASVTMERSRELFAVAQLLQDELIVQRAQLRISRRAAYR